MLEHLEMAVEAFKKYPLEGKGVRGHDKTTPAVVHSILCASLIMEDNSGTILSSYAVRSNLANTMLFHDVLEDTTYPDKFPNMEYIKAHLTIEGNSEDEYNYFRENKDSIPSDVWYLKTVDKYANIMANNYFKSTEHKVKYYKFLSFYAEMAKNSGFHDSTVVLAAELITKNYFSIFGCPSEVLVSKIDTAKDAVKDKTDEVISATLNVASKFKQMFKAK